MNAPMPIRRCAHPARPGQSVDVHPDWRSACEHLRGHVLSSPECRVWELASPNIAEVFDTRNDKARLRLAVEIGETPEPNGIKLYEIYCRMVSEASEEAWLLNWHASKGRATAALGVDGLLLIVEDVLRTAMFPGQGDPETTIRANENKTEANPLPRESGMRSGRRGRKTDESVSEIAARESRERAWSRIQRLYYHAFRPAVQFIRRYVATPFSKRDYGLLKAVLPPMGRLGYSDWVALRSMCGKVEGDK